MLGARVGTVVLRFDASRGDDLRRVLSESDFAFEQRPNALFLARREGVTLTAYASGKLLLTGAQAEEFAFVLAHGGARDFVRGDSPAPPAAPAHGAPGARAAPADGSSPRASAAFVRRVGSDESGKGDYFGPLVVAAVLLPDAHTEAALAERGVRDSKIVPDAEAMMLGSLVAARCPHEIVALPPATYNEVYEKNRNLNKVLAWAHARAIEDVLARHPDVTTVTVDQFAHGSRLSEALFDRGRAAAVRETPRAESEDLAVAAASLLARAEFLRGLAALEATWGQRFPKGAGASVTAAGRAFVRAHGRAALADVAKLHFVTTDDVDRRRDAR